LGPIPNTQNPKPKTQINYRIKYLINKIINK